jgi:uncharacterized protein YciI
MGYYLVMLAHEDYYEEYVRQLPTHRDHQIQWAARHGDQIVAIGSLAGLGFDQLWLVRTDSLESAAALVETSPDMRRHLVDRLEIVPWRVRWGQLG